MSVCAFLISSFLLLLGTFGLATGHMTVTSEAGTFRGSVMTALNGQDFGAFRGIPYAQPPVGELRFAKPKSMPAMKETYDATKAPPICVQTKFDSKPDVDIGQEDCLYLNVFTPLSKIKPSQEDAKRKVFVYIHGGGWVAGSGNDWIPGDLVTQAEIIVVTFNYRLSWLGFLQGPTSQLPGNQAYWDQVMVLQWTSDNIGAFGGDPNDITLGGESAGGWSTSLFAISPITKHLFTKAIIMSGSMFKYPKQPGDNDGILDALAKHVGCGRTDGRTLTTADETTVGQAIACLRSLPSEKFYLQRPDFFSLPRIDGELIPGPIVDLVADERYLEDVGFYDKSLLVSMTSNEGAILYWGVFVEKPEPAHDDFTVYEPTAQILGTSRDVVEKAVEEYSMCPDLASQPILDILSDILFVAPSLLTLETHSTSDKNHQAYLLYFDHSTTYNTPSPQRGVFHGIDLSYLFDIHPNNILETYYNMATTGEFTEEDRRVKDSYIQIFSDFIQTGHPATSISSTYQWLPYNKETEVYLNFSAQPEVHKRPLAHRRKIIRELMPHWIKEDSNKQGQQIKKNEEL